jgi:hypothetical protein
VIPRDAKPLFNRPPYKPVDISAPYRPKEITADEAKLNGRWPDFEFYDWVESRQVWVRKS